jgi:hypothetical protein
MRFVKTGPTRIRGLVGRRRPVFGTKRTNSIAAVMSANDPKRTFQRRWRCHSMGEHAPLTLVSYHLLRCKKLYRVCSQRR